MEPLSKKIKLLNTKDYLQMRREAIYNDSLANPLSYFPPDKNSASDLFFWDTSRYTDWQDELLGGVAQYKKISTGVSGGNKSLQFLLQGTYQMQTTVTPGDFSDRRGDLTFSRKQYI